MSVVEKAASPLNALARKKRRSQKGGDKAARSNKPKEFALDFDALDANGYFNPEQLSSPLAMELRAVKRRLLRRLGFLRASGDRQEYRRPGRQRNVVLVTSTQAGEGKTFCASNLALSLALEDQIETLLIDADIQRPKVCARFGLEKGRGLSDCLVDKTSWRTAVHIAKDTSLKILSEGRPVERPAALLASDGCQALINDLSSAYEQGLVIIDAPPALAVTDAVVLAKYVDEVIFVVEANETPEPAIAAALDELMDVNPNVSLVLNRCFIGATGASYNSYGYYGYGAQPKGDDASPKAGES